MGVTEIILQSVTLAFVIGFPLNHNARVRIIIEKSKLF